VKDDMVELFSMLGDSTRLRIASAISEHELCVHEIAETLHASVSAVSHQLRLLKTARLVKFRKEGKHVYYRLDDEHVKQMITIAHEHVTES
jgi:DNA-binding transcriptional ArsR family regulator